ncbi:MAG: signal peptidase I [Acidimicrobiales bacterium]
MRIKRIAEWVVFGIVAVIVAALLFVDVGPRLFSYQALVVRSGSMSPTIPTGSVVLYHKEAASDLKVGNVIVFTEPGTPTMITHRIFAIRSGATGKYIQTKGDANAYPDDWRVPDKGTGWEAFWHVPVVGYILWGIQTGWTRVLLIVVPAALLGALALFDFRRERRPSASVPPATESS